MSYLPLQPVNVDLTEIINLLEENAECCYTNTKYLIALNDRLNRYDFIFRQLLDCCKRPGNTGVPLPVGPVIPGDIVNPPPGGNTGVIIDNPIRPVREVKQVREVIYESYDTPYIPNGSVIDIAGEFKIVDNSYVDKSGTDLRRYLPYELNIKDGDILLQAILDYRVLMGGGLYPRKEVVLVFQTKNMRTGVISTYEAGSNHYRKWWQIHYK
jgi:hypothetical protein